MSMILGEVQSGIWKDENNKFGDVLLIDLSNTEPLFAISRNENEFSYPYTKIEKIDDDNVTLSISVKKNSNNRMVMTLRELNRDGNKKILVTSSTSPSTLTFIRPVLNSDYERTIKVEEANSRNAILINNCKVEIHNTNSNIIFYDETPAPVVDKTINSEVFKGNDGYAALIYSGLPPSQNNILGKSQIIKCRFSEDFKNITITTCNKLMSECD